MMRSVALLFLFAFAAMSLEAQSYRAFHDTADGVPVVRLATPDGRMSVAIAPSVGNIAYEFLVGGRNVFYFPYESLDAFAERPRLVGNPLLWPWANRLDRDGFSFAGKDYALNPGLGNFGRDGAKQPIHGLVQFSDRWEVVALEADDRGAAATSRLDFYRYPDLMAQYPFAHAIEMTYRLTAQGLEVRTRVENLSAETMPVSLGYHPYFRVYDAPRDEWKVRIAARKAWTLNDKLTPTAETTPIEETFPGADALSLRGITLDHVFGDLVREGEGAARFSVSGAAQRVDVLYGKGFDTAVVYAPNRPEGQEFICFEPMAGITNAFNLAARGVYGDLQTIEPGGQWAASFWVVPTGF